MSDYLMSFDIMKEMATRVCGRYIAWANAASDPETEQYWLEKALQVAADVRQVDPYDEAAITAKRAELRELFRSLPIEAPAVAA
ncbi:MAG: hypothetical protein Q4D96_03835 [Propionibacteriaceae bacterium]|nr:hypothetical protein [Propionibacteriaceae bacterium]